VHLSAAMTWRVPLVYFLSPKRSRILRLLSCLSQKPFLSLLRSPVKSKSPMMWSSFSAGSAGMGFSRGHPITDDEEL